MRPIGDMTEQIIDLVGLGSNTDSGSSGPVDVIAHGGSPPGAVRSARAEYARRDQQEIDLRESLVNAAGHAGCGGRGGLRHQFTSRTAVHLLPDKDANSLAGLSGCNPAIRPSSLVIGPTHGTDSVTVGSNWPRSDESCTVCAGEGWCGR